MRPQAAFSRFVSVLFFALAIWSAARTDAVAQDPVEPTKEPDLAGEEEQGRGRERVDIEPYTGPPVFLPEEEAPPAPTEVSSQIIKENYPELDTPHFERRIVHFSDDSYVSDGPNKEYYPSGQLYVDGQYTKSRASGEWTYYHPNGAVAKRVGYLDGLPNGEIQVFNEEGKLINLRSYKRGARHGRWADYAYDQGEQLQVRAYEFKEGKPHGAWKIWYKNGAIRQEQNFKEGKPDGLAVEWSRSGEKRVEANFADGLRHGETVIYRRDGSVLRRTFEEGRLVDKSEENAG